MKIIGTLLALSLSLVAFAQTPMPSDFVDETTFPKFTSENLRQLVRDGSSPTLAELSFTSWTCGALAPRLKLATLNFKTKQRVCYKAHRA